MCTVAWDYSITVRSLAKSYFNQQYKPYLWSPSCILPSEHCDTGGSPGSAALTGWPPQAKQTCLSRRSCPHLTFSLPLKPRTHPPNWDSENHLWDAGCSTAPLWVQLKAKQDLPLVTQSSQSAIYDRSPSLLSITALTHSSLWGRRGKGEVRWQENKYFKSLVGMCGSTFLLVICDITPVILNIHMQRDSQCQQPVRISIMHLYGYGGKSEIPIKLRVQSVPPSSAVGYIYQHGSVLGPPCLPMFVHGK